MRRSAAKVTLLALGTVPVFADIAILTENATVYRLNTTTGVATFIADYADPQSSSTQFSPNGLGTSGGSVFYATYNQPGNETIFRNGNSLLSVATANNSIAAGDAVGDTYYYVESDGTFQAVNNIFGAASLGPTRKLFGGGTLGDIAINGNTGYLSYGGDSNGNGAILASFDISSGGLTNLIPNHRRYLGLAFQGDSLFGVFRAGAGNFDLYSINTATLKVSKVADITGVTGAITDAARVPDGGMTLMLLGGALFAFETLRRRSHV